MKASFIILTFFIAGIVFGLIAILPNFIVRSNISEYALYVLMFLVGIGIGGDKKTIATLKKTNIKIVLVPLCVVAGSLIGAAAVVLLTQNMPLKEALAVSSGFGYYSLSSILLTKLHGETLGVIALLSNITREILTLLFAPLLAKYFGKLAPIASGGATSMDTTLPIIAKYSGKDYAIISIFSGVVLSILVPFLVSFLIK